MDTKSRIFVYLLTGGFAFISIKWTADLLVEILGAGWVPWLLAILLNAIEGFSVYLAVQFFRAYKKTESAKYCIYCTASTLSCLMVALISITGSFGGFQTGFQRNVTESGEYARAQKDLEIKQEAAGNLARGMSDPGTYLVANREYKVAKSEVDAAQSKLENLSAIGAGEGNAIFKAYASMWNTDAESVAERGNLAVGGVVEIIMLFLFLVSATENQNHTGSKRSKPKTQNGRNSKPKNRPKTGILGANAGSQNGGSKTGTLSNANLAIQNKKRQRIQDLELYLESYPDSTLAEMAAAIGVKSHETVRSYLKEMGVK